MDIDWSKTKIGQKGIAFLKAIKTEKQAIRTRIQSGDLQGIPTQELIDELIDWGASGWVFHDIAERDWGSAIDFAPVYAKELLSKRNTRAAIARHNQKNGSRDKAEQIKAIWASGKYKSRDLCAEQECAELNMSISTARKHLRNTPNA